MPLVPSKLNRRLNRCYELLNKIEAVSDDWIVNEAQPNVPSKSSSLSVLPCTDYRTLVTAWKKAIKWTPELDCTLSVMLACVASTTRVGEQLWVKVIGVPSSGKTTLLEGLAVNHKYVLSKSKIKGFHSGFKTSDGKDNSLITKVNGMTLATKDGDTLIKSPNLGEILSEARDIYDRTSRNHYRNAESTDYNNIRMTWILCGTNALREIDESELGARFLDVVVMDEIDEEFEDEVGLRAAHQEYRNMSLASEGDPINQYPPELAEAMRLSGGYVGHLRENADALLSGIGMDHDHLQTCAVLGKFVAFMRARPSKKRDENQEREFSPRLNKQMVRLAVCLAAVLNKKEVDKEVMERVLKVALDTSRGQTLDIVRHLAKHETGRVIGALALSLNNTEDKLRVIIRFLRQIGVVELCKTETRQKVYKLTSLMRKVYNYVEGAQA